MPDFHIAESPGSSGETAASTVPGIPIVPTVPAVNREIESALHALAYFSPEERIKTGCASLTLRSEAVRVLKQYVQGDGNLSSQIARLTIDTDLPLEVRISAHEALQGITHPPTLKVLRLAQELFIISSGYRQSSYLNTRTSPNNMELSRDADALDPKLNLLQEFKDRAQSLLASGSVSEIFEALHSSTTPEILRIYLRQGEKREGLDAYLHAAQAIIDSRSFPAFIKEELPEAVTATINTLRKFIYHPWIADTLFNESIAGNRVAALALQGYDSIEYGYKAKKQLRKEITDVHSSKSRLALALRESRDPEIQDLLWAGYDFGKSGREVYAEALSRRSGPRFTEEAIAQVLAVRESGEQAIYFHIFSKSLQDGLAEDLDTQKKLMPIINGGKIKAAWTISGLKQNSNFAYRLINFLDLITDFNPERANRLPRIRCNIAEILYPVCDEAKAYASKGPGSKLYLRKIAK